LCIPNGTLLTGIGTPGGIGPVVNVPRSPGPITPKPAGQPVAPIAPFTQRNPPSGTAAPFPPTGPINVFGPPPIVGPVVSAPVVTTAGGTTVVPTGPLSGVVVNVNQSVSLADNSASNAVQSVANAVYAALQQASGLGVSGQTAVTQAVLDELGTLTGSIQQGLSLADQSISGVVSGITTGIQDTLGGIGQTVANQIFNSINPVDIALEQIAQAITGQIGGLAGAVAQAVANIIPAIVSAVEGSISPATAALDSIAGVLSSGIGGLVTQAGAIASSIGGIGTTLDGVLLHYEQWNQQFVESQTGYPTNGNLHADLSNLAATLAGLVIAGPAVAAVKLSDLLTTTCIGGDLDATLNAPFEVGSEVGGFYHGLVVGLARLLRWTAKIIPTVRKINDVATQQLDKDCPTELLPVNQLVEAVQRGFITDEQAVIEAAKNNIDPSRFETLRNLAIEQLSPAQLIGAKYRSIITDADFQSAMAALGFTAGQINSLVALGVSLLSVSELQELRRRQLIDDQALKTSLASLQYDSTQQDALTALSFRPVNISEAIDGAASQAALQQIGLGGLASDTAIPEYVSVAGQNDGLDAEATAARWFGHWNVGSVNAYITLYFRGLIPIETVQAVMAKNYIPPELATTLIEAQRPIVQYRTISNMLRIGQIDVQTAGRLLQQHGYSAENAQLLITYAQRPGASAAAKKAAALHAVSLGIAKREYVDGAISENEYYQILLQHGYTVEGANAEIAVERANQAMLTRKQNAQLVVDEYGAGLIDEQTALAQLAVLGLTVYELAKYGHKIRVFRVKRGKQPSEAELNDFRKNHIITDGEYVARLIRSGFDTDVSQWFLAWRTTAGAATQAPASPAAPATGG
jgi:hypothetical protein